MALPAYAERIDVVNTNDSVELVTPIYDAEDNVIPAVQLQAVTWTVQLPDNTKVSALGTIQSDGTGYLRWFDTDQVGEYTCIAQFTTTDGQVKSIPVKFEVRDLFDETLSDDYYDEIADQVWLRLEDLFDSDQGGPYMRDWTMRYFNKDKVKQFIPDALMDINVRPPPTQATIADFTTPEPGWDPDDPTALGPNHTARPILIQATLCVVIRHLIRSYTEMSQPQGQMVTWMSRRDYLQRWQSVLQIEIQDRNEKIAYWKRQFLQLGHSRMLIASKSGRRAMAGYGGRPDWGYMGRGGFW